MRVHALSDLEAEFHGKGAGTLMRPRWSGVGGRTIYFGHQSVGNGVVAGIERFRNEYALPLRVVQTREPATVSGPAFVHFLAGDNRDYASKNAALLRLLDCRTRAERPIVLLKYCYVDLISVTESETMFEAYRDTIETLQFAHPDVTVVHSTIPLTTVEGGLRATAEKFLGRQTQREAAVARHRYNELMRFEFGGASPIFDLARVEATRADGTLASFTMSGALIETLAPENTYDGGHLAPRGERAAAHALLDVLAGVIEGSP
jgi:hypothetical protein